jgi:hypothetical protein
MKMERSMKGLFVWLTAGLVFPQLAMALDVDVVFDKAGLTELTAGETAVLQDGTVNVRKVVLSDVFIDPSIDENPYTVGRRTFSAGAVKAVETIFDADVPRLTSKYPWGNLAVEYAVEANQLDLTVTIANTGQQTVEMVQFDLMTLQLPGTSGKSHIFASEPVWARADANIGAPLIVFANYSGGKAVLTSASPKGPLRYTLASPEGQNETYHARVTFGHPQGRGEAYDGKWIARAIAPGKRDNFTLSLRFGNAEARILDMTEDVTTAFAEHHPLVLDWPDRRPIGAVHVADARTSPANPRGWKHGIPIAEDWDVRTDEGYRQFHKAVLKGADRVIAVAQEAGLQGIVVWQIEGQEFNKEAYYGEPRLLPHVAPEMDGVADAYFKKMRDAGLRVGICIRPLIFRPLDSDGNTVSWASMEKIKGRNWIDPEKAPLYTEVPDNFFGKEEAASPVDRLDAKIRYARERWGCTLFYIDTNHFWRPRLRRAEKWEWANKMLPSAVFRELHRRHPDILLIPEHEYVQYWSSSAPYRHPPRYGGPTPSLVEAIYPGAFSVLAAHPSGDWVRNNRTKAIQAVLSGDIFLVHGWFNATPVQAFYRDAAMRAPWRLDIHSQGDMTLARQVLPKRDEVLEILGEPERLNPELHNAMDVSTPAAMTEALKNQFEDAPADAGRCVWITFGKPPRNGQVQAVIDSIGEAGGIVISASEMKE